MPSELARQWFVSSEGIDRHVIVADIQRYLGNDATVRPGMGTGENEGVQGYWIKAYRNLTTAMISDLRADSQRWRQEQRMNGTTRGSQSPVVFNVAGQTVPDPIIASYVDSSTYQASNATAANVNRSRRDGDSPDPGYGIPARDPRERAPVDTRMPMDRMPVDRIPDRMPERMPVDRRTVDRRAVDVNMMDVDPPTSQTQERRYTSDRIGYPPDPRQFPQDGRSFPADSRSGYPSRDPRDQLPYSRAPAVSSPYAQDPMYANAAYAPPSSDGIPTGYVQRNGYYVPVSSYEQAPIPPRADPSPYGGTNPYSQPPPQRHESRDPRDIRDPRDPREQRDARDVRDLRDARDPRDPRYAQDYQQDPRYAYPSPVPTVSSVSNPRERESITSPPQQSPYGSMPSSYDQYGGNRPVQLPHGQPDPKHGGAQPSREQQPGYGRERPQAPSNDGRDARRRRMN